MILFSLQIKSCTYIRIIDRKEERGMKESVCVLKDLIGLTLNHCPRGEIFVNCKCN